MALVRSLIICLSAVMLVSCASSQVTQNNQGSQAFPAADFSRVLSQSQLALAGEQVSKAPNSRVWRSSDDQLIAVTKNGRAIALIEPGENWTNYYLFGAADKIMKYRVNGRDIKGAAVDFVYEAL